jgi:hypothetical protein
MPIDGGEIVDLLYARGPLSSGTIAAELGSTDDEATSKLQDIAIRKLVEPSKAAPAPWQVTSKGAAIGWERKSVMKG